MRGGAAWRRNAHSGGAIVNEEPPPVVEASSWPGEVVEQTSFFGMFLPAAAHLRRAALLPLPPAKDWCRGSSII
jgi:hypothetical protein